MSGEQWSQDLTMATTLTLPEPDTYMCTGIPVRQGISHVFSFDVIGGEHIHHLILNVCRQPFKPSGAWECKSHGGACSNGQSVIVWAWALNAPAFTLPEGVGFEVGRDSSKYFVVQIHYKNPAPLGLGATTGVRFVSKAGRPRLYAGMLLNVGIGFNIPPNTPNTPVILRCNYNLARTINLFHFRVHAHSLGAMVSGMHRKAGSAEEVVIARRTPQKPQQFNSMQTALLEQGDSLSVKCEYDSSARSTWTGCGAESRLEMCNLYVMFYSEQPPTDMVLCVGENNTQVDYFDSGARDNVPPDRYTQELITMAEGASQSLQQLQEWRLPPSISLLQVTGVAHNSLNVVYLFHRGSRIWGPNNPIFDSQHTVLPGTKPVAENCITMLDGLTGSHLGSWGAGFFYLPHGAHIDYLDNLWLTDVGAHQVHKFSPHSHQLLMSLGTNKQPGQGHSHFCKPTDVVVTSDSNIVVSDGYCNSRLAVFQPDGRFHVEVHLGQGVLPHSLALDLKHNIVFVADRENGRLLKVVAGGTGEVTEIKPVNPVPAHRKFAVAQAGGLLFDLRIDPSGPSQLFANSLSQGFKHYIPLGANSPVREAFWHDIDIKISRLPQQNKLRGVMAELYVVGMEYGTNIASVRKYMHMFTMGEKQV
eukprot:CAMPEP_0175129992 /NCGR_PEP_ID=MMETSP0087-20121206/5770_1 /TAXON_ID=136419 /ORGANISM="Unknown Unknown, Strain D1" /LENGTH=643 /DNA_ID=CAMNT_0016412183 /DNA_START=252 /DNA_END=2183 /DNA_ORIENTATION=+